jgi:hypothetical protein
MAYRTRIEIVETVTKHLLAQGKKSRESEGNKTKCLYRGPNGLQCAIGCLIPNDVYKSWFEDQGYIDLTIAAAANISPDDLDLARRLQQIHDEMDVEQWGPALEEIRKAVLRPQTG